MICPASVWHGLQAVSGLKAGRSEARETAPIMPVDDSVVAATIPHLSTVVGAMVQFQRFTGARPGEKLHEQLWYDAEDVSATSHEAVQRLRTRAPEVHDVKAMLATFESLRDSDDRAAVLDALQRAVPMQCPEAASPAGTIRPAAALTVKSA